MRQRELPLWHTTDHPETDLVVYSDIEAYRAEHYPRRGPALVLSLREEIGFYVESEGEDVGRMGTINLLVIELASLNPEWFDFSTEVFKICLFPTQTPPKLLQSLFEAAIRQLAKQVA